MNVIVTEHGWEQYCIRVEPIARDELQQRVQQQYDDGDITHNRRGWLHMGGVWWIQERGENLTLVTCYGRTEMDMPRAINWAKRHNDNIALQNI